MNETIARWRGALVAAVALVLMAPAAWAQVTTLPAFPTADDTLMIIYDRTQGVNNLGSATSISIHTGAVTSGPTGTGWTNVPMTWGDPAASWRMTQVPGNPNRWVFRTAPLTVRQFFSQGVLPDITGPIFRVGMVFRASGPCGGFAGVSTPCAEGKSPTNGDIFVNLVQPGAGLQAAFTAPSVHTQLLTNGTSVMLTGQANQTARLRLFRGLEQVTPLAEVMSGTSVSFNFTGTTDESSFIRLRADVGPNVVEDTFYFAYRPGSGGMGAVPSAQNPPAGVRDGINYMSATSVIMQLRLTAEKQWVYVLGDFTRWGYSNSYYMRRRADDPTRYWVEITGLTPGRRVRYQYEVDGVIRTVDPYAELVLDPGSDPFVPSSVFPNLPSYPNDFTTGTVGVFQPDKPAFNWTDGAWRSRPNQLDPRQLNFYELWVHNWSSPYTNSTKAVLSTEGFQRVIDSLGYLQRLGVNVIKLMPIMEFGGNISWGYNPNHQSAVDKVYGPPEKLKELINAAHNRGMAVVLDVVFNHTDRDNPVARLWWDNVNNRPAANSPYLNVTARHPFNVFYDMNHESQYTRDYMVQTLRMWMDEYHFDGFRFDLSKGFTQVNTGSDVGAWSAFDASRVAIWTYYRDQLRTTHPNCWLILEHLAVDSEEAALANLGFWMWGNVKGQVAETAIGGTLQSTDLRRAFHTSRGFTQHHLLSYAVSHDENRLGREVQQFAVAGGTVNYNFKTPAVTYDAKVNREIRYDRQKAALGVTWLIPGPKMMWMWDEFGYEIDINWCDGNGTINNNCRTNPKPPGWGLINSPGVTTGCTNLYVSGCTGPVMPFDSNAVKLQRFMAEIMNLRKDYPVFASSDIGGSQLDGLLKRLKITNSGTGANDFNVIVLANFHSTVQNLSGDWHRTGQWYEYFNGDSVNVTSLTQSVTLQPGEFRLYLSKRVRTARFARLTPWWRVNQIASSADDQALADLEASGVVAYPVPTAEELIVRVQGRHRGAVAIRLYDATGREVGTRVIEKRDLVEQVTLDVRRLTAGMYYLHVSQGAHADVLNIVKQ